MCVPSIITCFFTNPIRTRTRIVNPPPLISSSFFQLKLLDHDHDAKSILFETSCVVTGDDKIANCSFVMFKNREERDWHILRVCVPSHVCCDSIWRFLVLYCALPYVFLFLWRITNVARPHPTTVHVLDWTRD